VQRDYLLRMIEQLGVFIAGLRGKRLAADWDAFDAELADGYARFSGLQPSLVHALSEDDLVTMLSARGAIDLDRWWGLGELLREEGLALELLEEADEMPRQLRVDDLEALIDRLAGFDLSVTTRGLLIEYLVTTNRLDRAENVVSWSLDEEDPTGARHDEAEAFYRTILRYSDEALEAGGLSRAEVEAALEQLQEEHQGD
jgi:hypothetical protein